MRNFSYYIGKTKLPLPHSWPQPCQPARASCCPLQHLPSVKSPMPLEKRFLRSSLLSKRGLTGDLSLLNPFRMSPLFLPGSDYLDFYSSVDWLFFPLPQIKTRTWLNLGGKSFFEYHRNHLFCFWRSLVRELLYIFLFQDTLSSERGILICLRCILMEHLLCQGLLFFWQGLLFPLQKFISRVLLHGIKYILRYEIFLGCWSH